MKNVEAVIAELDAARAEGRVYTYGDIQRLLRSGLGQCPVDDRTSLDVLASNYRDAIEAVAAHEREAARLNYALEALLDQGSRLRARVTRALNELLDAARNPLGLTVTDEADQ